MLHHRTKDSVRKFGVTLSIDGWSSITNRPLINAMLISSTGEQFLGLVDTHGQKKVQFVEAIGNKVRLLFHYD